MSSQYSNEPMLDMYIFETTQNIEQLELYILETEKINCYTQNAINEIFRIMHTIKGSSAMMLFSNISGLAHSIEDLFYFLREQKSNITDCSILSDFVLQGVDFIKVELQKIMDGNTTDGDTSDLIGNIKAYLTLLKQQNSAEEEIETPRSDVSSHLNNSSNIKITSYLPNYFKVNVFFEEGCEMENIRAYAIIHKLREVTCDFHYLPSDIIENDESINVIKEEGFKVFIRTDKSYEEVNEFFEQMVFLKGLEIMQLENDEDFKQFCKPNKDAIEQSSIKVTKKINKQNKILGEQIETHSVAQNIISVNVAKLDNLMDLVGEMVIAEAMVTQNPDLKGLELDNFQKAARQLHKITSELQNLVMSIRMVPLANTFQKMHRVVRDMSKKLGKDIQLELLGEETEVDKNIIEHISDPLMHLVRNSIDHGIEEKKDREALGKQKTGKITLEAKNAGSDVLIIVRDDGKGLNKEKILKRATENNILFKPQHEMTDKEIYNIILLPGFSTKDNVSEFSGRGVGMDVVAKNIGMVGGTISVDSVEGIGTTITLRIPLTLAIIDGMNVQVGRSCYTIPIKAIKESFRPKASDLISDPDGNEMIMLRGQCYPIIRLHEHYDVNTNITDFTEGILVMVEQDDKTICIFADELLGQQQVVVKALPNYIRNTRKIHGLAGCTLLGDGSISLILDIGKIINKTTK